MLIVLISLLVLLFHIPGDCLIQTRNQISNLHYRRFAIPLQRNEKRSQKSILEMRWGLRPKVDINSDRDVPLRDTVPFEIRGFSLPAVVFGAGILLTASSFAGWKNAMHKQ